MCIICRMNDLKKLVSSLKANFWPWIAAPLLSYVIISVFVPVQWQSFSPLLSPKWGLALVIVLVSLAWREVLLPRLQAWRENRSKEMKEMQRLHAVEMAKWRKEATRLCRNCHTQYKDQEPAGGRFMCQQCGHVSKRPLLEIPGARPASGEKGHKQHFSGPQDDDQRLARICRWLDTWEAAFPGDHWKWCRSGILWTVLLVRAIFSCAWVSCLRITFKDESPECKEMRTKNEASSAERAARLRRKAEEKKLAKIEKELEEEEERLQREEVARLVEEQRQARLRELRRQQGQVRSEGKQADGRVLPQAGAKSKKKGYKEHAQQACGKQECKGEHQSKSSDAPGGGLGSSRVAQLHNQTPAAAKAIHSGTLNLQQGHAHNSGTTKAQPLKPEKQQYQQHGPVAMLAEAQQNKPGCTWKSVVTGSKKVVPEQLEASRKPTPAKKPADVSQVETFRTPCDSPARALSPPPLASPRSGQRPALLAEATAKVPAFSEPLKHVHCRVHSPSPPPVQEGSIPSLVSSPLRPQGDAKVQRPSPSLGAIGQNAIGQSPLRASSSGEKPSKPRSAQRGLNFDDAAKVESPESTASNWDIWDSLQLDSLVDSLHQNPSQLSAQLPDSIPGMASSPPTASWPQHENLPSMWQAPPAAPQYGFSQQQQHETNLLWSYSSGFGQDFLWQGEGLSGCRHPGLFAQEQTNKDSIGHLAGLGFACPTPQGKLDGLYVPPTNPCDSIAQQMQAVGPTWMPTLSGIDVLDAGVPPEFVDCITQEVMVDPVITADGHSYERSSSRPGSGTMTPAPSLARCSQKSLPLLGRWSTSPYVPILRFAVRSWNSESAWPEV